MSENDFFEFILDRDERWELVEGRAVEIASTTQLHRSIVANVLASLHSQLRGKACRATAVNTGVWVADGTIRYPDVVVDCGARADQDFVATAPTLVVELFPRLDLPRKVHEYRLTPGVSYVLLIGTDREHAVLHHRIGRGWDQVTCENPTDVIEFPAIDAALCLTDIYDPTI